MIRKLGVVMAVAGAMVVLPASASAAPPPGPPPSWDPPLGTSVPKQTPPATPPVAAPQAPAPSPATTQTQNTPPHLRVSCKRHSDHRWSCTVRTTDSNKPVTRCSGRGRVTASRRSACRAKALKSLGFATKAKAAQVNATREPSLLVCTDAYTPGTTGDIQTTAPAIFARDTTQDGWVGFVDQVQWWDGTKWNNWLSSDPTFHFHPADVLEQALEPRDWLDYRTGTTWEGAWKFTVPKGYWYAVRQVLAWFPQPSNPSLATMEIHAHQDASGTNPYYEMCKM
jgi:hypothetical protein